MSRTIQFSASSKSSLFDATVEQELNKATRADEFHQDEWARIQKTLLSLRAELTPYQLKLLQEPASNKGVISTRRSGKTYYLRQAAAESVAFNAWVNKRKAQPVVQYIAQTQKKAVDLFWTPFRMFCEQRIKMPAHWDDHNLRAQFSNGVLVRAAGLDTGFDIEKYRGDAYVDVFIDEAGTYGPKLEDLVVEGLGMAMADYRGRRTVVGTPGKVRAGFLFEAVHGKRKGWVFHEKWDFRNNPSLPPETKTDEWVEQNLGPLTSARVRREAFGEWASEAGDMVYMLSDDKNVIEDEKLPEGHQWKYILGLDVGYRDPTAWTIGAYAKTHPWLYVIKSESKQHMLPSEIFNKIQDLNNTYHFSRIVMDTGGSMALNTMIEWNKRSSLGILAADKAPNYKATAIEHLNSEMNLGRIKFFASACKPLLDEMRILPWEEDDPEEVRHDGKLREHPGFANHCCDSFLYMSNESRHYRSKSLEPDPIPGTPDYWAKQQRDAKARAWKEAQQPRRFDYGKLR